MNIVPKLGTENASVPALITPYLGDTIEIQLSSYDRDERNWRGIVEAHNIKTVILHTPFGNHNLETTALSPELLRETKAYLLRQLAYAEFHGLKIKVLFHVSMPVESLERLPVVEGVLQLLSVLEQNPRVTLLLENTIVNLDIGAHRLKSDSISYILERTPAEQVQVCFDLCHYLASKNAVQQEYLFRQEWLSRLFSVHFSETRNNEGYKNFASTHGCRHATAFGVARDLCTLLELGIDLSKVNLVAEITERDYQVREDEALELEWLHLFNTKGIQFG